MRPGSCRRGGPPWWPVGEPWPPQHGRFGMNHRTRTRFFRRVAFAAGALLALTIFSVFAAAWLVADRLGVVGWAAAIPAMLLLVAVVMGLAAMAGAMRRFASPLGEVMDAADRVARGNYAVRVDESGPPPIRALTHSFNAMTERLERTDRVRRDLMADVAHELRTPLAVLQGRLEGLLDGVYPRDDEQLSLLLDETRVLSRLVEDLRTLALSDAGALQLQKEPTDIVGLVNEVLRRMRTEANRKAVSMNVVAPTDDLVVDVDPLRMREVLTNLLTNALRHTESGGTVTVSIGSTPDDLVLKVTDTGIGMPPEEVARIFDRFYKGSASRGSGLGLTIARGIVTAHGGEIAASSRPGEGTTLTLTLPRSEAAA
jgi:signal transduction histidine kinase